MNLLDVYRNIIFVLAFVTVVVFGLEASQIVGGGFTFLDPLMAGLAILLGWRLSNEKGLSLLERFCVVLPVTFFLYHVSGVFGDTSFGTLLSGAFVVSLSMALFLLLESFKPKKNDKKVVDDEVGNYPIWLDNKEVITTKMTSQHVQIIGTTGSGKSDSYFRNARWQSIEQGKGSFSFDAKSDELETLAYYANYHHREKDLVILDIGQQNSNRSHRVNPLAWFKIDKVGNKVPDIDTVSNIAVQTVYFGNESKDDYYPNQGMGFLSNFTGLFLRKFPIITYNDYYHIVTNELENLTSLIALCEEFPNTNEAAYFKNDLIAMPSFERRKLLSGLRALLVPFVTKNYAPLINCKNPDFLISDIVEQNKIFLFGAAVLSQMTVYKKISAAFLMAFMTQIGRRQQGKIYIPFDLFLDEFSAIVYPEFIDILEKVRSMGVCCHLGHQSLSDLERVPVKGFSSAIIDNTTTKIIFRILGDETGDRIAKVLGTKEADIFMVRSFKTNDGFLGSHTEAGVTEKGVNDRQFHVSPDEMKAFKNGEAAVSLTYKSGPKKFTMQFPLAPQTPKSFDMTIILPEIHNDDKPVEKSLPLSSRKSVEVAQGSAVVKPLTPKTDEPLKSPGAVAKMMREHLDAELKNKVVLESPDKSGAV